VSLTHAKPLVSIGLPTYNGERYLREALECLVSQDYENLEILVSDNASTDETASIAMAFAARDPRVRLIRETTNKGPAENFNRVFRETSGPLFMWAADDDRWEPSYVSACVAALASDPSAVLACTRLRFLGDIDDPVYKQQFALFDNPDLSSLSVERRVRELLSRYGWYAIYGLIRRDVLAQTRLFTSAFGPDVILLVELAMRGPFVLVTDALFHYRLVASPRPDRDAWEEIVARERSVPYSGLQEGVATAIARSGLPIPVRIAAWLGMIRAAFVDRTPIRAWIGREVHSRLAIAIVERDFRSLAKYGTVALHRKVNRALGRTP
jgi:glycosyltransferase involved in cell wall biosynthesis